MNQQKISRAEKLAIQYPLREYQVEWIEQIYRAWNRGKRKVLAQLPTAAGKTVALSHISNDYFLTGKKVLVLAHRLELVEQAADKLRSVTGVEIGIIKHGFEAHLERPIQVASIQTLTRRNLAQILPKVGLLICDEAHHATARTYREVFDFYSDAAILGVTATPQRQDGQGFTDLFDVLVEGISTTALIKSGFLSPYKLFVTSNSISTIGVKKSQSNNDYLKNDLALAVTTQVSLETVLKNWYKFAGEKKTVIFAASLGHSKAIASYFSSHNISCEHLDAETPEKERRAILARFSRGITSVITNYQILTEGYDCPNIECVYCLRPTTSPTLWLQMIGRSLRTARGKKHAIVIDLTENWKKHGLPDDNRQWDLSPVSLSEDDYVRGVIKCSCCTHVFRCNLDSLKPLSVGINNDGQIIERYQVACPNCRTVINFEKIESKRYQSLLRLKNSVHPEITEIDLSVAPERLKSVYDLIITERLKQLPSERAYKSIFTNFIITLAEFTLGDWREIVKMIEPDRQVPSRQAWQLYLEGKTRHQNRIAALAHLKRRQLQKLAANGDPEAIASLKQLDLEKKTNGVLPNSKTSLQAQKIGERHFSETYRSQWQLSLQQLPAELGEFLLDNAGLFFVDLSSTIAQISIEVKPAPMLRKFKQKEVEIAFSIGFKQPVHLMFRINNSYE
ncbi:MAG: DEAD/DEAH box helicase [Prochloraceae cyanobacterium]|nr:DEAD/DEAH box helicase [Prochloraceae cyanobacterium]